MLSFISDNIEIYNYDDDNTVICSGYEYEDVKAELMLNVDKIIEWFQDNHMKVNPDKFQCRPYCFRQGCEPRYFHNQW